jgi:hypothetical protein
LFSRVRVTAPSWLGCVGPASRRRPVGRRRGRERGFRARQYGTTCRHRWSYGEGVGHQNLDRAEGIQRGTPAFGPGNFRGLEARPRCGHSPRTGSPAESDVEPDDLVAERGTSMTSLGSPTFPLASRELPVPAEQSLGRDEEGAPAPSRQQPGEGDEAPDPQGDKRRAH